MFEITVSGGSVDVRDSYDAAVASAKTLVDGIYSAVAVITQSGRTVGRVEYVAYDPTTLTSLYSGNGPVFTHIAR
jgi:hypothetical protein